MVKEFHEPRQVGFGKVLGAHAGVEFIEAEIDRVRAIFDGGFGAIPVHRQAQAAPALLERIERDLICCGSSDANTAHFRTDNLPPQRRAGTKNLV